MAQDTFLFQSEEHRARITRMCGFLAPESSLMVSDSWFHVPGKTLFRADSKFSRYMCVQ